MVTYLHIYLLLVELTIDYVIISVWSSIGKVFCSVIFINFVSSMLISVACCILNH